MRKVIIRRRVRKPLAAVTRNGADAPDNGAKIVDNARFEGFNPSILGLGNIALPSREIDAIAAVFDLAGFTRFCNQVDPHLAVPAFLSQFLDWLFNEVRIGLTATNYGDRKALWAELPFLAKFLGDGVLLLWNTLGMSEALMCRVVTTLYGISRGYRQKFYPEIRMVVEKPPMVLRCGLARGRIFSVGNGRDCVGHCINTASRLQKLSLLTFCFPNRGFNIQQNMQDPYRQLFVQKAVSVRGVGENELVWVLDEEFNKLPEKHQLLFRNPDGFKQ